MNILNKMRRSVSAAAKLLNELSATASHTEHPPQYLTAAILDSCNTYSRCNTKQLQCLTATMPDSCNT